MWGGGGRDEKGRMINLYISQYIQISESELSLNVNMTIYLVNIRLFFLLFHSINPKILKATRINIIENLTRTVSFCSKFSNNQECCTKSQNTEIITSMYTSCNTAKCKNFNRRTMCTR